MDVDTKTQGDGSTNAPRPHDALWFPDGSVVLATDKYLFKVYKGLLSANSSFFRGLFDLPPVGGAALGTYDGLPLVTMVGDKGEEVAHLLRTVHERNYYERQSGETHLEIAVALLKLSTKYDFTEIRNDIVNQIAGLYPMSLDQFDEFREREAPMFGELHPECHLALLAAAFEANIDVLLPALYLSSASLSLEFILNFAMSMDSKCHRTLIVGREFLGDQLNQIIANLPEDLLEAADNDGCPEKDSNSESCVRRARFRRLSLLTGSDIHELRGSLVVDVYLSSVCSSCETFVTKSIDHKREKIWDEVHWMFDCLEWNVAQEKLREYET